MSTVVELASSTVVKDWVSISADGAAVLLASDGSNVTTVATLISSTVATLTVSPVAVLSFLGDSLKS
jgi:hypothetical protein